MLSKINLKVLILILCISQIIILSNCSRSENPLSVLNNNENDSVKKMNFINNNQHHYLSSINPSDPDLAAYWKMDQFFLSLIFDYTTNYNYLWMYGPTGGNNIVTGVDGNAIYFDGINNYADLYATHLPSGYWEIGKNIPIGNSPYTIEAWIKPDAMGARGIVGWGTYGEYNKVNVFRLTSNGLQNYWWYNDLSAPTGNLIGQWHHVACTYDGTSKQIYLDGRCIGGNTVIDHNATLTNFTVGRTFFDEYFIGAIDELAIWKRALTASEIGLHYGLVACWKMDEGSGNKLYDSSIFRNNGNLPGLATWVDGKHGKAVYFNGSNIYAVLASPKSIPVGNSPYTIEAWINPDSMGARGIVGWGTYVEQNKVNSFRLTDNGLLNSWWANDLYPTTGNLVGQWHHVACTYDGTTRKIYLDGSCIASDTPGVHNATLNNFTIGRTCNNEYFKGAIDDLCIWNRALTLSEIQAHANQ